MSNSIKLVTPVAILSFPTLYVPRAFDDKQEPKYSAMLGFEQGSDLGALKKAITAVAKAKFGDTAAQVLKNNNPLRDHDQEVEDGKSKSKGFPEGTLFFNARSKNRPAVVARTADGKGKPVVIDEAMGTNPGDFEMYGGVMVKAYLSVYAYDTAGNRGVAFGLEGVQRWEEGERLDGKTAAATAFDFDMAEETDLSDVMGEDEDTDDLTDLL